MPDQPRPRGPVDAPPQLAGRQGLIEFFLRTDEGLDFAYSVEEVLDAGGPCFAANVRRHVTGDISGLSVADEMACVYTMRRGRLLLQETLYDHRETRPALIAAAQAASGKAS